MLSGTKAFKRDTAAETTVAILTQDPPPFTETGQMVPPALDRVVRHCLERDPDSRFHSARDVVFALSEASGASVGSGTHVIHPRRPRARVLGISIAALAALIVAGLVILRRPQGTAGGVKRLAVLPFENLGSADDDYFANGITDEVRGKLTKLGGLEVIARTSSTGYRKTTKKPQEIGKELEVEYLVTGTVRFVKDASGNRRVQVSPELVVASSASSKWAEPFDATLTDVFRVQEEIAKKVAEALDTALSAGSKKSLEEKPTQNLAAYEAYLRGEQASQAMNVGDPPSLRRAVAEYERAVALDPGFVAAWARIGAASALLYGNSTPTPELAARARAAAEKALSLAPDRPEGHYAMSYYSWLILSDSARAVAEADRARATAPGDVFYVAAGALTEQAAGLWKQALEHLEEARRLDPRSALALRRLGNAALWLRRTAKARDVFAAALSLAPTNLSIIDYSAMTSLQEGDLAAARAVIRASPKEVEPTALVADLAVWFDLVWVLDDGQRDVLLRLTPAAFDDDRAGWALCLTQAYLLLHDEPNVRKHAEIARAVCVEQVAAAPQYAQRHAFLALSLAYLGRKDEAMREARRAVELLPVSRDALLGPYILHQLVRVCTLTGEHEKAMDALEELMKVPYFVTKGWLKIDPNFDPLRKNPRFVKLVG